jgi:hypothetical protein
MVCTHLNHHAEQGSLVWTSNTRVSSFDWVNYLKDNMYKSPFIRLSAHYYPIYLLQSHYKQHKSNSECEHSCAKVHYCYFLSIEDPILFQ